jgi:pyruvate/2-oxoglutarate dehydrogenase complex dihydrolipoamide acyltransferase (E2) component
MSTIEVRVPQLPESVADATLVAWRKQPGDTVSRDENLVDLETDKVVLEVPAPATGVIVEIKVQNGATVTSGQLLALLEEGAVATVSTPRLGLKGGLEDSASRIVQAVRAAAAAIGVAVKGVDVAVLGGPARHRRPIPGRARHHPRRPPADRTPRRPPFLALVRDPDRRDPRGHRGRPERRHGRHGAPHADDVLRSKARRGPRSGRGRLRRGDGIEPVPAAMAVGEQQHAMTGAGFGAERVERADRAAGHDPGFFHVRLRCFRSV